MRNEMRFTPSAARDNSIDHTNAAASQWMMANCRNKVNIYYQLRRSPYASQPNQPRRDSYSRGGSQTRPRSPRLERLFAQTVLHSRS